MPDLIGRTLANRYRIDAYLGHGGMAEVYRAWDVVANVNLALKLLDDELARDPDFVRRLKGEATKQEKLNDPNIVHCYGWDQDGQRVFMLMDYVDGDNLREEIGRSSGKPFAPGRILEIMGPVCSALDHAHRRHLIHCDIKPGNVMIDEKGRVLVTDFGIARFADTGTQTMVGFGSPAYMAPEQIRGERLTEQTDIYALGVVLFEMLTGGMYPFDGHRAQITGTGSKTEKIRWEKLRLDPFSPRKFNSGITPAVEDVVMKCLHREPGQRFKTALGMYTELDRALKLGSAPSPAPKTAPAPSPAPKTSPAPSPARSPARPKPAPVPRPAPILVLEPAARASPAARPAPVPAPLGRNARAGLIVGSGALALLILLAFLSRGLRSAPPPAQPQTMSSAAPYFTTDRDGHAEIYRLENGTPTRVTTTVGGESWSPFVTLTRTIYFTSDRDGHAEIYRLENGTPTRVTDTSAGESWSPFVTTTGTIYFTTDRDGHAEIYRLERGTATRVTTTVDGGSWSPFVTPTGTIYFTTDRDGHAEIYRLENGTPTRVTDTTGGESWSPFVTNTGTIYFTTNRDGHAEIYRLENGTPTRVTDTTGGESWSPFVTITGTIYFTTNRDGHAELYRLENGVPARVTNTSVGASWLSVPDAGLRGAEAEQSALPTAVEAVPTLAQLAVRSTATAVLTPLLPSGTILIAFGDTLYGKGGLKDYGFYGTQGQRISIVMTKTETEGGQPSFALTDEQGTYLESDVACCQNPGQPKEWWEDTAAVRDFPLPYTGTYFIKTSMVRKAGAYSLHLELTP